MNKLLRELLVLGSLVIIAAMPTHAAAGCDGGIGGTRVISDGGIGGTGIISEGGIGGTGNLAGDGGIGGTGIVGAITGFASICVNGLEVHFDGATLVSINGTTADATQLAVGQIVAVYAENSPKGLYARSVAVLHVLEGPVTGISQEHGVVLVMGRTVRMTSNTTLDGLIKLGHLTSGDVVRVSGYKNAHGEIVATRIQLAQGLRESSAIGIVSSDKRGHFALDGLPVSSLTVAPEVGNEAMVRGDWNGKELIAREILREPSLPFAGRVDRVVAEGLIIGAVAERVNISGFEVQIGDATKISGGRRDELLEGRKVRITGQLESGRLIKAERIELGRHGNGIDGERNSRKAHPKQMGPGVAADAAMMNGERGMSSEMSSGAMSNRIERPERMEPPAGMEHMNHPQMGMGRPGGK